MKAPLPCSCGRPRSYYATRCFVCAARARRVPVRREAIWRYLRGIGTLARLAARHGCSTSHVWAQVQDARASAGLEVQP